MKWRILGVFTLVVAVIAGWWYWQTDKVVATDTGKSQRAPAQVKEESVKVGRYHYISGVITMIMVDTQTGKSYALSASPHPFSGRDDSPTEYAWVPIQKFEDPEAYRRWLHDRRELWMRERMERERKYYDKYYTGTGRFYPSPTTGFRPTDVSPPTKSTPSPSPTRDFTTTGRSLTTTDK